MTDDRSPRPTSLPGTVIPQRADSALGGTPPHVERASRWLARRSGIRHIVEIGCASGHTLAALQDEFEVTGIAASSSLNRIRATAPSATVIPVNLEHGLPPTLHPEAFAGSLVICANVIHGLGNPRPLIDALAQIAEHAALVLVATPHHGQDAPGLRARATTTPPEDGSATDFLTWLRSHGFAPSLSGSAFTTDRYDMKATAVVIGGRLAARPRPAPAGFRVAAVIHAYNEADILEEVTAHLTAQGVEVHLFDNWSTDGTWELATDLQRRGLIRYLQRFPGRAENEFRLAAQTALTADYGYHCGADWVLHHDADEIRTSPWPGVTLRDALAAVSARGFTAIDSTVIDFRFTPDHPAAAPPYERSLTHFEFGRRPGHFVQIKGWARREIVDLTSSGGHEARFGGRRVFPLKFLLKHYPLRTRVQAERKIFRDRLPRTAAERKERNWHTQYDTFAAAGRVPGWQRSQLTPWNPVAFSSEFLLERLTGIGLTDTAVPPMPPSPNERPDLGWPDDRRRNEHRHPTAGEAQPDG